MQYSPLTGSVIVPGAQGEAGRSGPSTWPRARCRGVTATNEAAVASVDFSTTTAPKANAVVAVATPCSDGGFTILTQRFPADGGPAVPADDVGFSILIP